MRKNHQKQFYLILKTTAAMQVMLLNHGHSNHYAEAFADGFHEGASWADANPNWHKYPEEKPNECDEYIVAFENGNVYTAHYIKQRYKWHDTDIANNLKISKVIAWMEFPIPPKFD